MLAWGVALVVLQVSLLTTVLLSRERIAAISRMLISHNHAVSSFLLWHSGTRTTLLHPKSEAPELHPTTIPQAPITFYWMEMIKCSWCENPSERLCDHEFLLG